MDFKQIVKEYGGLLSRVASTYEANPALQQELLQEIALAVWQGLERYRGDSQLKTYLLKIAHNRAVTHVATAVRHPQTSSLDDDETIHSFGDDGSANPEYHLTQSAELERLLEAVRALPLPARQVVTLSLEGLSYDEIAQICGLTTNHVGVLLKRAKERLNRSMQND